MSRWPILWWWQGWCGPHIFVGRQQLERLLLEATNFWRFIICKVFKEACCCCWACSKGHRFFVLLMNYRRIFDAKEHQYYLVRFSFLLRAASSASFACLNKQQRQCYTTWQLTHCLSATALSSSAFFSLSKIKCPIPAWHLLLTPRSRRHYFQVAFHPGTMAYKLNWPGRPA